MSLNAEQPSESILTSSLFDNLLGSLFDAVPEGVLIVGKSNNVVYINERMRELWNFPEKMTNQEARKVASSLVLDPEKFQTRNEAINNSDDLIHDEQVQLKDGRMYMRSTKPLIVKGKKEGRIWTYQDISSQNHATKLRESLIDHAPIGIALANEAGCLVHVNQAWADTLGYTQEALIGTSFKDHTHPEDLFASKEIMREIGAGQINKIQFEKRHMHSDGSVVNTLIHIARLPKHGEQNARYIAQIVNITQLKNAEQALFQSQKLESIGVLAGGIAHDFNNLLVAIKTQADVALLKSASGKNPEQNIEKIKLATKNASYLTEQLLAYSGRRKFRVEDVDLNVQIEKNNGIFHLAIPKNIELKQNLAADLPNISAEKGQIQQILLNLVINGAESLEGEPGELIVTTEQVSFSEDEVLSAENYVLPPVMIGSHVCVSVTDSGIGMDEETLEKIFDPFFTTKFTGRGLGLAAALGIIRAHNGAMRVISQLGKGTTFELYFPTVGQNEMPAVENAPTADDSTEQRTDNDLGILLIDDDENVRDALKDLFEYENIKLICAANGSEGIQKLLAHKDDIALTLLDLSMPGLSSPETFVEIKKINPELPVMLCSGYSESKINESFEGEEIAGFLAKPFDANDLITLVTSFTNRSA